MGEYLNIGYARKILLQRRSGTLFTRKSINKIMGDLGEIYRIAVFTESEALLTLDERLFRDNLISCSAEFYEKLVNDYRNQYFGRIFCGAKYGDYTYEELLTENEDIRRSFEGQTTIFHDISYVFKDELSIRALANVAVIFSEGKAMFEAYEDSFSIIRNMLHICLGNPLAKALVVSLG